VKPEVVAASRLVCAVIGIERICALALAYNAPPFPPRTKR
jgi:hypothetical protein